MSFRRIAGIAGVLFVASVVITIIMSGSVPALDEPASEVVEYYEDQGDSLRTVAVFNQLTGLFVAVFAAGLIASLRAAERGTGRAWAVVALIGIITGYAAFDISNSHHSALLLSRDGLGADPATRGFFDGNQVAFFAASFNLAIFLLGVGAGILTTRILPVWLGWLALAGTVLGVISAFGAGDRDGMSSIGMLGLGTQTALLLFALVTGILMARDTSTEEAAPATA